MSTVAILGAGDLGGAAAQALAARDRVGRVLLVDTAAQAAAGKALDIKQSGAVSGFHVKVESTDDISRLTGCAVCIVADRFGAGSPEWQGEEGLALLKRVLPYLATAPLIFAGAFQASLMAAAAGEAGVVRDRLIGSAAEGFASAIAAIVAMEARCSPGEVMLTVLGTPPGTFVVPWSEASIGGYALDKVLEQVQLNRIEARVMKLWPPGAYTLGAAAARVAEAVATSSRRFFSVLTVLNGEFGVRNRVGAVPALLSSRGIAHIRVPSLCTRERVLVDTALASAVDRR